MPPVRRVGSRTPHLPEPRDLPDFEEDGAAPQARAPADPALVAGRLLLKRALAAAGLNLDEAGRDGTVCVVLVPSTNWAVPVRDAWRTLAHGGEAPSSHPHGFVGIDMAAALCRARLIVHGHHHESMTGLRTPSGVAVRGLGRAEAFLLRPEDLP